MNQPHSESVAILGVGVTAFDSYDHAVEVIRERLLARTRTFCIAMNPEKMHAAAHNPQVGKILAQADIRICDGVGISLASMLLHGRRLRRCTGIDLFCNLIRLCEQDGFKVFILGASPEANQAGCDALRRRYPGLKIVGTHHGFFHDTEPVIDSINCSGADLLFVAMGSPRQEFWISEHIPQLESSFCMGIGGTLDVISGRIKRAPAVFRKTGTEWLYRLLSQPSRIRRQAVLPIFAVDVLKSMRYSRTRAVAG